ncbi:hypothetical protein RUND412_007160 [Rhizina undulata]
MDFFKGLSGISETTKALQRNAGSCFLSIRCTKCDKVFSFNVFGDQPAIQCENCQKILCERVEASCTSTDHVGSGAANQDRPIYDCSRSVSSEYVEAGSMSNPRNSWNSFFSSQSSNSIRRAAPNNYSMVSIDKRLATSHTLGGSQDIYGENPPSSPISSGSPPQSMHRISIPSGSNPSEIPLPQGPSETTTTPIRFLLPPLSDTILENSPTTNLEEGRPAAQTDIRYTVREEQTRQTGLAEVVQSVQINVDSTESQRLAAGPPGDEQQSSSPPSTLTANSSMTDVNLPELHANQGPPSEEREEKSVGEKFTSHSNSSLNPKITKSKSRKGEEDGRPKKSRLKTVYDKLSARQLATFFKRMQEITRKCSCIGHTASEGSSDLSPRPEAGPSTTTGIIISSREEVFHQTSRASSNAVIPSGSTNNDVTPTTMRSSVTSFIITGFTSLSNSTESPAVREGYQQFAEALRDSRYIPLTPETRRSIYIAVPGEVFQE